MDFLRLPELSDAEREFISVLYDRLFPRCMTVAIKITRDKQLAEDAVHMAFLKVVQHKEKIFALPCHKQGTSIVIIVKNKAIDIMRGKKLETFALDECGEKLFVAGDDFDVQSAIESKEGYNALLALIDALPEKYRVVFQMRYIAEQSNEEIAAALGIPKNTVAKQLERARQKLRQKIQESGDYLWDIKD